MFLRYNTPRHIMPRIRQTFSERYFDRGRSHTKKFYRKFRKASNFKVEIFGIFHLFQDMCEFDPRMSPLQKMNFEANLPFIALLAFISK